MEKTWEYRNRLYVMEISFGYGNYKLNGYHTTDSTIWDGADDDESPRKQRAARRAAERFVSRKNEECRECKVITI